MLPIKPTGPHPKFYKEICKKMNRPINIEIKNGLSENELFLKVDCVSKNGIFFKVQYIRHRSPLASIIIM